MSSPTNWDVSYPTISNNPQHFNGMKKTLLTILLTLSFTTYGQTVTDAILCDDVKSVFLSRSDNESERPFLRMGRNGEPSEQLMLRFDILWPQAHDLRYRIRHCNADWEIDDLEPVEYINGREEAPIENYQFSIVTRITYVNYYQMLPDTYTSFTASGNYLLEVFPTENPDSILFTRRFCVYEDLTAIEATIAKPSGAYGNINRDQEVSLGVTPVEGSFLPHRSEYYKVKLQQNRRADLCRWLPFDSHSGNTLMYRWHAENVFPGGNCFRYFDLSNLWAAMYHVQRIEQMGGENFAFLQPEEDRSTKNYSPYASLNGGMKINIREHNNPHTEADYVWVNFSLPMTRPYLNGNIYIVGELTQWRLDDASRMEWNSQYKAYTKRLLLKQGYYAYQLLFLPIGENEALTATLEGDHYAMKNSYTAYIYLRMPGARYDRLVGLREFMSP